MFQEKYVEAIKGLTLNKINLVSNEINLVTNEKISHKKGYLIRGDLENKSLLGELNDYMLFMRQNISD